MHPYLSYALQLSFSAFVACASVFVIAGAYLLLFKVEKANAVFRHPYLEKTPYRRYPMAIRMGILLDYFLRLAFPRSQAWLAGHANRLLAHVDPADVPTDVRWPIVGFWGACLVGIVAMIALWSLLLMGVRA